MQSMPKSAPLPLWPWATEPWQRVHVDFAEVRGQSFFLAVDSHSKLLEVIPMSTTVAEATISGLRLLFLRFGLPVQIVSDNGPQFTSHKFKVFLEKNGIKHTSSPPYHPASNGLAERHVQTFKHMFKKTDRDFICSAPCS